MPSVPTRRRFLRSGGLALVGVFTGCVTTDTATEGTPSPTPTDTPPEKPQISGTYADTPEGPEPYPDRPETLTRNSVRQYVEEFEFAATTNTLHRPDLEDISIQSRSVYDTAEHGGHYAIATCSGYANYADGTHADWGQVSALYFVSPELTVRIGEFSDRYFHCTEVFAAEDPAENFAEVCSGGDASYRVYNYHPESHTVSVTVEFLGNQTSEVEDPPVVLERTYDVGPASGIQQGSVTYRMGTYRITATLENGVKTTYQWELQTEPSYDDPPASVTVTPVDGITVRHPPIPKVR